MCNVVCLIAQSCPTLCDPLDYSPSGSYVHGDSPGKNAGMGCHALLQGIFPSRESNPGLPHCRLSFYCLSYQGSHLCVIVSNNFSFFNSYRAICCYLVAKSRPTLLWPHSPLGSSVCDWSGLPFPSPGDLPDPGVELHLLHW